MSTLDTSNYSYHIIRNRYSLFASLLLHCIIFLSLERIAVKKPITKLIYNHIDIILEDHNIEHEQNKFTNIVSLSDNISTISDRRYTKILSMHFQNIISQVPDSLNDKYVDLIIQIDNKGNIISYSTNYYKEDKILDNFISDLIYSANPVPRPNITTHNEYHEYMMRLSF